MQSYDITEFGKPLKLRLKETPQPKGSQILLKVSHCGICHSDVHIKEGYFDLGGGKRAHVADRGMTLPFTLGHEVLGTVVAVGDSGDAGLLGTRRLVYPWIGCGECAACHRGSDNFCGNPRFLGVIRNGGYADHLLVDDSRYLVDVEGIDDAFAPILACSGLTAYSAIGRLGVFFPEDWIVVIGAGGLGLMAISLLRAKGHSNIAVVDTDKAKHQAAMEFGAALVVDPKDPQATDRLRLLPGRPAGVLDMVGNPATLQIGLDVLRKGGRHILVGMFGGAIDLPLVPMVQRALRIEGCSVGSVEELREVVALARSGKLKPIPISLRPWGRISEALDELASGKVVGRIVAFID